MAARTFRFHKWAIHKEHGLWKVHLLSDEDKAAYGTHELAFPSSEGAVTHLAERCLADIEKCILAIREKQGVPHCQYRIDAETCEDEVKRLLHDFELFECLMNGECVHRVEHGTGGES